jgi:hypothetical protein
MWVAALAGASQRVPNATVPYFKRLPNINQREFHMRTLIAAATMLALSVSAQAYQIDFTGRVTNTDGSLSGVTQGTLVSGSFVGNEPTGDLLANRGYYSFASGSIVAHIGGHELQGSDPRIEVTDNDGGNVEDRLGAYTTQNITVDGSDFGDSFSIYLSSKAGSTSALVGTGLPTQIDFSAFDADSGLSYGALVRTVVPGSPSRYALLFELTSVTVTSVPEPSTLALLGLGMVGIGCVSRRRSQQAQRAA